MQQFNIGVIVALRQHARDHPALLGNPQAAVSTKLFEIDPLLQVMPRQMKSAPDT